MTQINNLITSYQATGCEESFNALYEIFAVKLTNVARKQARLRGFDVMEAESIANFHFYEAVAGYNVNIGDFEGFMFNRIINRIANAKEKETTHTKYAEQVFAEAATSTDNLPEITAIKKEQRQLLDKLYADAPPKSRQALAALASTERFTFREAGKRLGVKHETVKNRIEKISAGRQDISLNDYITA